MSSPRERKKNRTIARLNACLDRNLASYVAAAGAAGVAMLSISQEAQAKVVYTAANVSLGHNTNYALDLNNDGVPDFEIANSFYQAVRFPLGDHNNTLTVKPEKQGNRVILQYSDSPYASALPAHRKIGPDNAHFEGASSSLIMANSGGSSGSTQLRGPWFTHRDAYLGLKFVIDGTTHYGWARVIVTGYLSTYTIVGYAYETVPNQSITTGETSGPVEASMAAPPEILAPSQQPATLGMLARGGDAVSVWRRDFDLVVDDRSKARA